MPSKRKKRKPNLATLTRHFPKKGERFVDGEWVVPKLERQVETAADRRNFFRKQAGWPLLQVK